MRAVSVARRLLLFPGLGRPVAACKPPGSSARDPLDGEVVIWRGFSGFTSHHEALIVMLKYP